MERRRDRCPGPSWLFPLKPQSEHSNGTISAELWEDESLHTRGQQRRVASAGLMLGVGKSRVCSWAAGPRREAPALASEPQGEGRTGERV